MRLAGIGRGWEGIAALALLMALTWFLTNHYRTSVNADFLMFSIMSLQRVTVFYWDQDRILNLIPMLASVVTDPAANLQAITLAHGAVFVLLAAEMAHWSTRAWAPATGPRIQFFLLFVSLFVLSMQAGRAQIMVLQHIEYTASLLLMSYAYRLHSAGCVSRWLRHVSTGAIVVLSVLYNPSIVICYLAVETVRCIIAREVAIRPPILWAAAGVIAWLVFRPRLVGRAGTYFQFSLTGYPENLAMALGSVLDVVSFGSLWATIALAASLAILLFSRQLSPNARLILLAVPGFGLTWLAVFAANGWVQLNGVPFRYFIVTVLSLLMLVTTAAAIALTALPGWLRGCTVAALAATALATLLDPPRTWRDTSVFAEVAAAGHKPIAGTNLHAGSYWLVWPAVLSDTLHEKASFGFADRAKANRENLVSAATRMLASEGQLKVNCFDVSDDECAAQVLGFVNGLHLMSSERRSERMAVLTFAKDTP